MNCSCNPVCPDSHPNSQYPGSSIRLLLSIYLSIYSSSSTLPFPSQPRHLLSNTVLSPPTRHKHNMCTETIYSFRDRTCICKRSTIVTCPKAQLPPPEKRKTQYPACVDWVMKYGDLAGKCKGGKGECEKE